MQWLWGHWGAQGGLDLGLWFLMWAEPLAGEAGVHKYIHGAAAQKK